MAYWKLRLGDEFMIDGRAWRVVRRRDTLMIAHSIDGEPESKELYLWRVLRDGHLLTPGPAPSGEIPWQDQDDFSVTLEDVAKNLDRPASVKHNADGIHLCLTLSRQKDSRMPDGTFNWQHVPLYFTIPMGSERPSDQEALDAVVGDCIGFEDAPGSHTWMRPRRQRRSIRDVNTEDPPGMEAWAIEHGYGADTPEAAQAYTFVRKRSRKLWGLGTQDLYHALLWDAARLASNPWRNVLSVTGQIPPASPSTR